MRVHFRRLLNGAILLAFVVGAVWGIYKNSFLAAQVRSALPSVGAEESGLMVPNIPGTVRGFTGVPTMIIQTNQERGFTDSNENQEAPKFLGRCQESLRLGIRLLRQRGVSQILEVSPCEKVLIGAILDGEMTYGFRATVYFLK